MLLLIISSQRAQIAEARDRLSILKSAVKDVEEELDKGEFCQNISSCMYVFIAIMLSTTFRIVSFDRQGHIFQTARVKPPTKCQG